MRHLLFVILTSIIVTPIVALQDQLTGQENSNSSVQHEMLHTLDQLGTQAEQLYQKAEARLSTGVRELLD